MSNPTPSIRVNVDVTNPGQFFACCGLLELADRLWPGAEGWFEGREFCVACAGTLRELLVGFGNAKIESSLTDAGLKKLGTLLSAAKTSLSKQDEEDKERLRAMWQRERVHISEPFNLWLDWWWDELSGASLLKTWAAKQFVLHIARPLLAAIEKMEYSEESLASCLVQTAKLKGLPFYFDAASNTQTTPRDYGVAPSSVKQADNDRPLVELLAFIGLQRCRPLRVEKSPLIRYTTWPIALPVSVIGAATLGVLQLPGSRTYAFRMLYRTEYMKAFLPAQLFKGD